MRTSFPTFLASCILMVMTSCFSVSAAQGAYRAKAEGKKLIYSHGGQTLVIEAWGRDGLRVRVTPSGGKQTSDWALDIPSGKAGKIEIAAREATIRNGKVSARIHDIYTQRGRLQFFRHTGEKKTGILSEHDYVVWGAAPAHHDIMSSFEHLEEYMRAGLNLAMSGIPWGASGIGGFVTPDRTSPRFHELMVRWYQYGVFCPIFRTHGHRPNNEAWTIGGIAYPHVRAAMLLRENLRPYIMKQMHLASKKGLPPMRPVFFDFESDPKTAKIEDQYLFGADLLVAPITKYEARSREVYLPVGAEWTDAWTGRKLKGGQVIKADAPITHIPVYVRGNRPKLLKCFKDLYEDTGVIEAENLSVLSKSSSRVEPQRMDRFGPFWSAGGQMVWWGKLSKGDTMVLEVPVEKTAEYEVQLYLSKAHDYGIFTFQLDGGRRSKAIDIYDPKLQAPTIFKLEPMKLFHGKHQLKIECRGKNPKSANTLIGIDYIVLKKKGK